MNAPGHTQPAQAAAVAVHEAIAASILDADRLAAVRATALLDSAPSAVLDELTALAARLLDAPLAFLTVVDDSRSHWVSCIGVDPAAEHGTTVAESFCQYVVADVAPVVIEDASVNPRTRNNPTVTTLGVRAWAGYPLVDADGRPLGSFCVVDTAARSWTTDQVETLGVLARAASAQVSLLSVLGALTESRAGLVSLREREVRTQDRLSRLTAVALELTGAQTVEDLTRIVIDKGLPVLGADGGAVSVRDDAAGVARLAMSHQFGPGARLAYGELPLDSPLPAAHVTRTGETVLLPDRAAGLAWSPLMAGVYEGTRRHAWATLPLRVDDAVLGALVVSWEKERDFPDDELELLHGFAAQCAQSLARIQTAHRERVAAAAAQRFSESLQRSLLTQPPTPDNLSIAVRYQPAAREAQIGGDWYDAFVTATGSTVLVIGDVNGHDRIAAAAMGQVRNIVRGMAYDSEDGPSVLLERLDAALRGLEVDTLATAAVVRVDEAAQDRARGRRRLRWSNAGHLPPLLRLPDGRVEVLGGGDLLLGVQPDTRRTEQTVEMLDGSTLLLYTDGLIERRQESITEGLERLVAVLAAAGGEPEQVCDTVLAAFTDGNTEDDIALLALRADPDRSG